MITETFEFEGVSGVIRRRTNRTDIVQSRYASTIWKLHPDLDMSEAMKVTSFTGILSQIVEITGEPFPIPAASDKTGVSKLYEHFLDDENGLWDYLQDKRASINAPLSSADEKPEAQLSAEERTIPNSVSVVSESSVK